VRVAYLTNQSCGAGHAVRGVALVRAGRRAGIEVRAFGPRPPQLAMEDGWAPLDQAPAWQPDLVLGDIVWSTLHDHLDAIERYGTRRIPAWLLVNGLRPPCFLCSHSAWVIERWARRISIEPLSHDLPGVTHRLAPIVVANLDEIRPSAYDGEMVILGDPELDDVPFPIAPLLTRATSVIAAAGYNAFWEATWLGYRSRVRWTSDRRYPDRAARVALGGDMTTNGADALMTMIAKG